MATECEIALEKAKTDFAQSVDDFAALKFIQQHTYIAMAVAAAAGALVVKCKFPKIKNLMLLGPALSVVKTVLEKRSQD